MSKDTSAYSANTLPQGSRVVMLVSTGPSMSLQGSVTTMPDLVGKSQGAALEAIGSSGLSSQVVYDYNPFVRKGTVTASMPHGGVSVPIQSDVLVLVSSGDPLAAKPATQLPIVIGMSEQEATSVVRNAGLNPQVMYQPHAAVPANHVIDQLPNQSTFGRPKKSSGSGLWIALAAIALIILGVLGYSAFKPGGFLSSALSAEQISVPDMRGMTQEDATKALTDAELELGEVSFVEAPDEGLEVETVIKSKPAAETKVNKGSAVNLVLVLDPNKQPAEVPDVEGKTLKEAKVILENAGFIVTSENIEDEKVKKDVVISQAPAALSEAMKGSTIRLVVSVGPEIKSIKVPDVEGISQAAATAALKNAGLKVKVTQSSSNSVDKGIVIKSSPAEGDSADVGSTVVIVVSTGASGATVTIPDYEGGAVSDAKQDLEYMGMKVKLSPSNADGAVAYTDPNAGAKVKVGSTVTVFQQ